MFGKANNGNDMSSGLLRRIKAWAEAIGGLIALTAVLAGGIIALLAAFGPFETTAQHAADIARVDSVARVAADDRGYTLDVVSRLYCERLADQEQVSREYCESAFPIDLQDLLRARRSP